MSLTALRLKVQPERLLASLTDSDVLAMQILADANWYQIQVGTLKQYIEGGGFLPDTTLLNKNVRVYKDPADSNPADGIDMKVVAMDVPGIAWRSNGTYYSVSSPQTVTLDAPDAVNSRFDLIYLTTTGTIDKKTGTPAADPAQPTIAAYEVGLAYVLVETSGDVTITDLSDKRVIYVDKNGSDSNSGRNPNNSVLTFANAVDIANSDDLIQILDSGQYIDPGAGLVNDLFAPDAEITNEVGDTASMLVVSNSVSINVKKLSAIGTGDGLTALSIAGGKTVHLYCNEINGNVIISASAKLYLHGNPIITGTISGSGTLIGHFINESGGNQLRQGTAIATANNLTLTNATGFDYFEFADTSNDIQSISNYGIHEGQTITINCFSGNVLKHMFAGLTGNDIPIWTLDNNDFAPTTPTAITLKLWKLSANAKSELSTAYDYVWQQITTNVDNYTQKVSSNDTTPNYLESKLTVNNNYGANSSEFLEFETLNDGADETRQLNFDNEKIAQILGYGLFETTVGDSGISGSDGVYSTLKAAIDAGFYKIKLVGSTLEIASITPISGADLYIFSTDKSNEIDFVNFPIITNALGSVYFENLSITGTVEIFTSTKFNEIQCVNCNIDYTTAILINPTKVFYFDDCYIDCGSVNIYNTTVKKPTSRFNKCTINGSSTTMGVSDPNGFSGIMDSCYLTGTFSGLYFTNGYINNINGTATITALRLFGTNANNLNVSSITTLYLGDNTNIDDFSCSTLRFGGTTTANSRYIKASNGAITTLTVGAGNKTLDNIKISRCTVSGNTSIDKGTGVLKNIDIDSTIFTGSLSVVAGTSDCNFSKCKFSSDVNIAGDRIKITDSNTDNNIDIILNGDYNIITNNHIGTTAGGTAYIDDNGTKNTIDNNITEAGVDIAGATNPNIGANNIKY